MKTYTTEDLEKMLHSKNRFERLECAKQNYALDILKDDEDLLVRKMARLRLRILKQNETNK